MNNNEKIPPTDDEREILVAAIDTVLSSVLPPNARAVLESALRRSEVPEPSTDDREKITDAALWDFAGDLLDAWNIEDTNAPSMSEDFRDRFVARFHPAYRPDPQGEPSDAQVENVRRALKAADIDYSAREQRADAGGGDMEPGDWFTFLARAALRAAGGVQ